MRWWMRSCAATGTGVMAVEIDVEEMKMSPKADAAPVAEAGVPLTLADDGPAVRTRAPLARR